MPESACRWKPSSHPTAADATTGTISLLLSAPTSWPLHKVPKAGWLKLPLHSRPWLLPEGWHIPTVSHAHMGQARCFTTHRKWLLLCRAAKDCVAHLHLPGTSRILSLSKETTVSRREARQTLYSTHSVFTVTCGTSSREINDAFDVSVSNVNLPSTHLVFEYHPAPPDT